MGYFYVTPSDGTIWKNFLKFLLQDIMAVLFAVASICISCNILFIIFFTFSDFVLTQKIELVVME